MRRILIVDDEQEVLRELSEYLRNIDGYEITTATSAKEAIEHLEGVDLAIVDMFMETEDSGIEVLKAAKQVAPWLQCIVLTAYGSVPDAVEAMESDAYDYIEKQTPYVYEILGHKVRRALEYREIMLYAASASETNEETETAPTLETEIDSILRDKTYEELESVLKRDRENALGILYKRTKEKVINLKTEDGKKIWKIIMQFHKSEGYEEKIDSICSKLAEYSETKFYNIIYDILLTKFDRIIYDILFTINAGVNADIRAGFWLADKFANHRKEKWKKKR